MKAAVLNVRTQPAETPVLMTAAATSNHVESMALITCSNLSRPCRSVAVAAACT